MATRSNDKNVIALSGLHLVVMSVVLFALILGFAAGVLAEGLTPLPPSRTVEADNSVASGYKDSAVCTWVNEEEGSQ